MEITKKDTKDFIKKDIYRNCGKYSRRLQNKVFWNYNSTIALLYFYRWCHYYCNLNHRNFFQRIAHSYCYIRFKKLQNRCGIEMNQHMKIGYGLRLPHKGCIILHPQAVIGNNCEIMQGVTLGNNILKDRDKVPVVGDDVLICAGAKVIGNVKIGNQVVIGANAVVNRDVENNVIVGGVPAKVIGKSNNSYLINTNFELIDT